MGIQLFYLREGFDRYYLCKEVSLALGNDDIPLRWMMCCRLLLECQWTPLRRRLRNAGCSTDRPRLLPFSVQQSPSPHPFVVVVVVVDSYNSFDSQRRRVQLMKSHLENLKPGGEHEVSIHVGCSSLEIESPPPPIHAPPFLLCQPTLPPFPTPIFAPFSS